MRAYDAVIFDLDGTLFDTSEGISRSVGYVIDTLGFEPISDAVMRTFIGPPIQKSFARVFGMDKEGADKAADMFRNRYKDKDILLAKPYEGIFDTIRALSEAGIKTAVATYKRQDYAEKILKHFGFDKVCAAMCGSDAEGILTKNDIILNAAKELGVIDIKHAVMVGDSDNDALGAADSHIPFIGVTYGFGFATKEDVDAYPNIGIADRPEDILGIVL